MDINKDMKKIDTKKYGLNARTILYQTTGGVYVLIKNRKSRIIMKDGHQIIAIANTIHKQAPKAMVALRTNAPICSKTKLFLEQKGIKVELI